LPQDRETKYIRNKIRHLIIPEFEKVNPSFRNNIHEVTLRLRDLEKQLIDLTAHYQNIAMTIADEQVRIDFTKFPSPEIMQIILLEMVRDYGFNSDQVKSMVESAQGESGRQFFSDSYRLVKDRNEFIITKREKTAKDEFMVEKGVSNISVPVMLSLEVLAKNGSLEISSQPATAYVDYDRLAFPLKLRKWQKGDRFMPFGMNHFKKLSDFFTDSRMSLVEKESVWLVVSGEDIVWIVNHRIDNRYRITEETQHVLKMVYMEQSLKNPH
jgi:tRNA(Ile)-lysidine synthase